MEECEFELRCLNSDKCFRCFGNSLLKLPEDKNKSSLNKRKSYNKKRANEKDSWKTLEEDMVTELKKIPTMHNVRRTRGSGNQWFDTGDVIDELLKLECKERKGNELSGGDKSISIKKSWLNKATEEAALDDKIMALPFRFKGDDVNYIIFNSNDILELVNLAKAYRIDNDAKANEIKLLKEEVNNLKKA